MHRRCEVSIMEKVKKELKIIGIIFIIAYIFFQIHYYKENIFTVIRLIIAHFYLFVIPGYFLMLPYIKKISFAYRLFIGAGLGYGAQSLISFMITLVFHMNMKTYYLITPLIFIFIGMYFSRKVIKWSK